MSFVELFFINSEKGQLFMGCNCILFKILQFLAQISLHIAKKNIFIAAAYHVS